MSKSGLANRLYRGEAGLNLIGKRKIWFGVAGALILVALLSFGINRFSLGIEFAGGNQFIVPASNSVTLMVSMPYNPSRNDASRFQSLRTGDFVRFYGVFLNNSRVELRQFY